uniref:CUB domain-containing protein n=1 Tax=Panagrellus redivivus TaxID=6233 RepID=A0A7E4V358_PANRE
MDPTPAATRNTVTFIAPPSCEGTLRMCYAAPPRRGDHCLITFTPQSRNNSDLLRVRMGHANLIATIDGKLAKQCPLKKPDHYYQSFNIVKLPNCTVIVHGVTLPHGQPKRKYNWLLPACITVIVLWVLCQRANH